MNLNKAFKRSIARYLDGVGTKEMDNASEEPFTYTLETLEAIADTVLEERRTAKKKAAKKASRAKKKTEESDTDGE